MMTRFTVIKTAAVLFAGLALMAATRPAPLPPNYQTTFENTDILVMRVHYGAHEFVPMHDHTAYPTLYTYLNDSGPVKITHEVPDNLTLTRPPTHTGAFRIAPGAKERHSVQSMSDTPSDFLRVELKRIPVHDIKTVIRGDAPKQLAPGTHTDFEDKAIQVDRTICPESSPCTLPRLHARSLVVAIDDLHVTNSAGDHALHAGDTLWLTATEQGSITVSAKAHLLRAILLYP